MLKQRVVPKFFTSLMRYTIYDIRYTNIRYTKRGAVLLMTFIIMATLSAIGVGFLYMISIQLRGSAYDVASSKAFWLAEAGLQKAVWNLKTPVGSGGQGEDWTTAGTTEDLGDGDYTMVVERWDWALAANSAAASASSENGDYLAINAIDGDDDSYWQSGSKPTPGNPQEIIITFPYALTINKVRFYLPSGSSQQRPKEYSWQVSSDDLSYTTVASDSNNSDTEVTDEFTAETNVSYLKLEVTKVGGGPEGVIIATLEAIGSKVTSTGTADVMNREIEQTVAVDDLTQTAYNERDWNETS